MVIIGTGGLAKDIVASIARDFNDKEFYFFNDRSDFIGTKFLDRYPVIRSFNELEQHFKLKGNAFVSAIANPLIRKKTNDFIRTIGGELTSFKAINIDVSEFIKIGKGSIFQTNIVISSLVEMGEGTFINSGTIIGHDVKMGKYVTLGPGVRILGKVEIGDFSYIGCNAVITPGVKIGQKVRVGIGKIINKNIPDGAKII